MLRNINSKNRFQTIPENCCFLINLKLFAMRKNILLVIGVAYSFFMNAQIMVTKANLPVAGDAFAYTIDTMGTAKDIPYSTAAAAGPWDFSKIISHGFDYIDSYLNPSAVPNAGKYADSANVALEENGNYVFISTKNDVLVTATIIPQFGPFVIRYTSPLEIMPSGGIMLNTTFTNYSSFEIKYFNPGNTGTDSVAEVITKRNTFKYDAEGTLTTPSGVYNVLRKLATTIDSSAVYMHDSKTNKWALNDPGTRDTNYTISFGGLVNNKAISLLELVYNNKKVITSKVWFVGDTTLTTINKTNLNANISLYPTLVNDKLFISSNGLNYSGTFYDIYGRQILTRSFSPGYINIQNFTSGIYFCRVINSNGQLIKIVKIIKM